MCYTECFNKVKTKVFYLLHQIQEACFISCLLFSTLESDKAVESVLASKGREKTELISKMLEDEKYQREAFQALLLQQDDRALEIGEQMSRIQNELASLTFVEMKKRDMKVSTYKTFIEKDHFAVFQRP